MINLSHNYWTEEEKQYLKDNYTLLTDEEMSATLLVHTKESVATMRRKLGLIRNAPKYNYDDVSKIVSDRGYELISVDSEVISGKTIVAFKCSCHGEKTLQFSRFVSGRGCNECNAKYTHKRVSEERDIQDCKDKNLIYVETKSQVIGKTSYVMVSFICNNHAEKGVQTVKRSCLHFSKLPCKYCTKRNLSPSELREVINDSKLEYIEVLTTNIKSVKEHVKCKCNLHNETYETLVESVIEKRGCPQCTLEKRRNYLTFDEAKIKLNNNKTGVELLDYKQCKLPITVKCENCGEVWNTLITSPSPCPNCDSKYIGESLVYQFLKNNNVTFVTQHKFKDCVDKKELVFDFYLPELNMCIEYNGKQHYMPIKFFGGEPRYQKQLLHDEIKREYCKNNNITLIEIKYTENTYNKIEKILKSVI